MPKFITSGSFRNTVTGTAQDVGTMTDNVHYMLAVDVACYFRTDGTDAAEAAGSHYLEAGASQVVTGDGAALSIIKKTGASDGVCTLSVIQ